jgi:F-type H+-transporting ATPase subunit delta
VSTQAQPQDYARAIYELALEAWTRQLGAVHQALAKNGALSAAVNDPGTGVGERLELLDAATAGGLHENVRKFIGTLIEEGQLDQLEIILVELDRLVQRRPERQLARVTSAVPLTSGEQEALRAKLVDRFGPDLDFQFDVDAGLIGGVHLRVGDKVIDGSVAGKLSALRDRLAA